MSDTTIFNSQTADQASQSNSAEANAQSSSSPDPILTRLGEIKNEKGEPKYRDLQTALDALKHSQEYIPQIKSEKDKLALEVEDLRIKLSKFETIENTVQRLTSEQTGNQNTNAKPVSSEEIASLIDQAITRKESQAKQQINTTVVVEQIMKTFGKDAEAIFYSKGKELGISPSDMNALAAKSPDAVLQLFEIKQAAPSSNPNFNTNVQNNVNTTSISQSQTDSYLGRNTKPIILGATTQELITEHESSKKLVEELHNQGMTTYDLTDPKKYFKHFA